MRGCPCNGATVRTAVTLSMRGAATRAQPGNGIEWTAADATGPIRSGVKGLNAYGHWARFCGHARISDKRLSSIRYVKPQTTLPWTLQPGILTRPSGKSTGCE